ncbi:NADPH-dependent ferric siderophore reductase [Chryseobacterium sp. H1D6B]|uniref:siderophore-interacting protein n=1 Tax=Chryseobacterium sp. H1D6B TaxID=2940588 RepID=UPI0015CDE855|nr:FAD-binding oxidoreductase [Chryseobacterium sp. H1D6B]MDH6250316.1 NADPH-dependent ferric siderophore reductase [Chryseobacterium sp. H1D6B]
MPSLPKWINDTVESVLSSKFKDCTITKTENISDSLRLVRFKTDLRGVDFAPTYAIGIRINERDFRNYSPFNFDQEKGTFDIIFHLHNTASVGCNYINQLSVGDSMKILLPRGKKLFDMDAKIHFSVGDETSLGNSLSIKDLAEGLNLSFLCLHELEEPAVLETLGLYGYYTSKNRTLEIIETLKSFLKEEKETIRNGEVVFYLTGNGKKMTVIRKFLKSEGVAPSCIKSQAYWIEGKKGL